MATIQRQSLQMIKRVPRETVYPAEEVAHLVGTTPVARYSSWADHRSAIRRSAEDARSVALAR